MNKKGTVGQKLTPEMEELTPAEEAALDRAVSMIAVCRRLLAADEIEFTTADCIAMAALVFKLSETEETAAHARELMGKGRLHSTPLLHRADYGC